MRFHYGQGFVMVGKNGQDFIIVTIPCLNSSTRESEHLDGISVSCGPPVKTFKVLNLSNQQW